jgi:hypothetical protein
MDRDGVRFLPSGSALARGEDVPGSASPRSVLRLVSDLLAGEGPQMTKRVGQEVESQALVKESLGLWLMIGAMLWVYSRERGRARR